jgi:hypothetical protein
MNKKELLQYKRGSRLFQKIQPRLLPRHKGHVVAIESNSGRYFIGRDELEAAHQAMAAMPGKIFGFFRVGYPAVHKFRALKNLCR